ncbi:flavodoxin [Actinoplanes sp. NBC_00393]|uniref:flavodoxin n=1 Tax=Actinoplanes sp. NBC_00393 TaxID=2975953 RepID=UPI002E22ECCD
MDMTRRHLLGFTALGLAGLGVAGCSSIPGLGGNEGGGDALARPVDGARTLIAYFSLPLTDDPENMNRDEENSTHVVDGKVLGNTQHVAQIIQARTGAELFRIETAQPLPLDFPVLEKQALQEQESDARPELKALVSNLDDYDTVFVGYPIYWYDMPMPLYTFLERHEFGGKTIIPFTTHGGSRLSGTVEKIAEKLGDATVVDNAFTISRDDMDSAEDEVGAWLDSLGVTAG